VKRLKAKEERSQQHELIGMVMSNVVFEGVLRDRNGLLNFSNGLSKSSRTSIHNYHQNTQKPHFMTISVFR